MLFVFETAAARRGGSEEPRYQFPANISTNCNLPKQQRSTHSSLFLVKKS
jgi:hypothetical protein